MGRWGKLDKKGAIYVLDNGLGYCRQRIIDVLNGEKPDAEAECHSIRCELQHLKNLLYHDARSIVPISYLAKFERTYNANVKRLEKALKKHRIEDDWLP